MWNKQGNCGLSVILNQRGIAAINGVFMGVTMAIMAGVAIDVGHALLTQNELHNASDAAALAASRQLGVTYLAMTISEQQDLNRNLTSNEQSQVNAQATAAAFANSASNISNLSISQGDIEFGTWDFNGKTFTPTVTRPNAIRATTRRDGAANGPITTFFGGYVGGKYHECCDHLDCRIGDFGRTTPSGSGRCAVCDFQ